VVVITFDTEGWNDLDESRVVDTYVDYPKKKHKS
jgi:hypothetical protein